MALPLSPQETIKLLMKRLFKSAKRAFTLVEMLIVISILAILVSMVVVGSVSYVKTESRRTGARATVKTLSEAFSRVKLVGASQGLSDDNPGVVSLTGGSNTQQDAEAAVRFYYEHGFIREIPSLDGVAFLGGEWKVTVP